MYHLLSIAHCNPHIATYHNIIALDHPVTGGRSPALCKAKRSWYVSWQRGYVASVATLEIWQVSMDDYGSEIVMAYYLPLRMYSTNWEFFFMPASTTGTYFGLYTAMGPPVDAEECVVIIHSRIFGLTDMPIFRQSGIRNRKSSIKCVECR